MEWGWKQQGQYPQRRLYSLYAFNNVNDWLSSSRYVQATMYCQRILNCLKVQQHVITNAKRCMLCTIPYINLRMHHVLRLVFACPWHYTVASSKRVMLWTYKTLHLHMMMNICVYVLSQEPKVLDYILRMHTVLRSYCRLSWGECFEISLQGYFSTYVRMVINEYCNQSKQ